VADDRACSDLDPLRGGGGPATGRGSRPGSIRRPRRPSGQAPSASGAPGRWSEQHRELHGPALRASRGCAPGVRSTRARRAPPFQGLLQRLRGHCSRPSRCRRLVGAADETGTTGTVARRILDVARPATNRTRTGSRSGTMSWKGMSERAGGPATGPVIPGRRSSRRAWPILGGVARDSSRDQAVGARPRLISPFSTVDQLGQARPSRCGAGFRPAAA